MTIRRILLSAPLVIITFVGGLWFVRTLVLFRGDPISLCEVTRNSLLYTGQTMRIKGILTGKYFSDSSCGGENGAWSDIELVSQPEFERLKSELKRLNTADSLAKADTVIVGTFQYMGETCTAGPFKVSEARIEQAGPIVTERVNESIQPE